MLLSLLEIGFDHLNKLELLHPEMNLTQWFWKRKILNAINVFCYYFPFGKGCGPSFEQTETLHTKVCYVPRLVDIRSMVLRESTFLLKTSESPLPKCKVWLKLVTQWFMRRIWKAYRQRTDGHTIFEEQKGIRIAHLIFKLIDRWAKKICRQILWQTSFDKSKRSMINEILHWFAFHKLLAYQTFWKAWRSSLPCLDELLPKRK